MKPGATLSSTKVTAGTVKPPLRVGILLARNFTLSAFSLFVDTLRLASDELDRSGRKYLDWDVVSDGSQLIPSSSGISVAPTARLNDRKAFDYLVVVGGRLNVEQPLGDELVAYLKKAVALRVPVVGLCTGSFVLAQAGLLAGRTACVSWLHREEFQQRFPDIELVSHRLFLEDGLITTCAGGTAVADLAAWIVKKHVGVAAAKNAMEILQIDRQRKGTDTQARLPLAFEAVKDSRVRLALLLMEEAVHEKRDIEDFAHRIGISSRQLERLFKQELNESPVRAYQRMRLVKAKLFVEATDQSILQIAIDFGYESNTHFSKMFRSFFGMSPVEARKRAVKAMGEAV
ncbi:MAG: GlxA family transcriptional regulator [Alphaproteobacteria bacterium]|nr:GlxA family transcriptional regulator [Alphaproteobacteria bacterium]